MGLDRRSTVTLIVFALSLKMGGGAVPLERIARDGKRIGAKLTLGEGPAVSPAVISMRLV